MEGKGVLAMEIWNGIVQIFTLFFQIIASPFVAILRALGLY